MEFQNEMKEWNSKRVTGRAPLQSIPPLVLSLFEVYCLQIELIRKSTLKFFTEKPSKAL